MEIIRIVLSVILKVVCVLALFMFLIYDILAHSSDSFGEYFNERGYVIFIVLTISALLQIVGQEVEGNGLLK